MRARVALDMRKKRIHIVIGTRTQLIKMAPVMLELKKLEADYNFIFLAQHHATIADILRDFGLGRPDIVIAATGHDIGSVPQMLRWSLQALGSGLRNRKAVFRGDRDGIAVVHGAAL